MLGGTCSGIGLSCSYVFVSPCTFCLGLFALFT